MSTSLPNIAIVGGGPGGLTLALLLHRAGVPATVYELRERPTEDELALPSGSLDLHEESGLKAIRACGLYEEFLTRTNDCSESMKIIDGSGTTLHFDDGGNERPEISRHQLLSLLLSGITTDMIKWGHKIHGVEKISEGKTKLDFGPNGSQIFDVVVGADGSWSRVRSLLSPAKPEYTGIQNLTLTLVDIPNRHPELAEFCGDGTVSVLEHRNGVMGQRGVGQSERLYIMISSEHEDFATREKIHEMDADSLYTYLTSNANLFGQFGDLPKKLIRTACDESTDALNRGASSRYDLRPLYRLPIGHSWDRVPGITIIGDAAHLMTPYAGEGVNLAMADALDIAEATIAAWKANSTDVSEFQKAFSPLLKNAEQQVQSRAEEKAEESENNKKVLFGDRGAVEFTSLIARMMAEHGGRNE